MMKKSTKTTSSKKMSGQASTKNDPKLQADIPPIIGQRILVIVESPKKIKSIASYLPKNNSYRILPSVGHIMELAKDGRYNLGIDLNNQYEPKFIPSPDRTDVIRAIIDAAKDVDKILIATDPDREGEHIGYSVATQIQKFGKPIKRIEIHEITKTGVNEAIKNERDIDTNLVQAAVARRVLDRVVGFLTSPLVIKRLGKGLSAGRVQSVALRLLVERELEIEAFKAEEYWVIQSNLSKFASDIPVIAKLHGDKVINEKDALAIKTELENSSYSVFSIDGKRVEKGQPKPITTSRLQMLASSRFGFGGQRTMKAAQKLYEEGAITYIRTDSVRQSDEAVADIRKWISTNKPSCLPTDHIVYRNKKGTAQDAHESIRPTHIDKKPVDKCATDEDKLYKLIWEVTIASQMTPAIYDTTTVTIMTNMNRELKATGSILRDPGWLSVTQYSELEKEDEADSKLPPLVAGDTLTLKTPPGVSADQKFTQPPRRYSEGSLVKELEKRGIGRPSTFADITNKITSRDYVAKKGNSFVATDVGKKLVEFLCKHFSFMEYDYTSDMEEKLEHIASGKYDYVRMMDEFYPGFKENINQVYHDTETEEFKFTCVCGKAMFIKKGSFGYFLGCSSYPVCRHTVPCEIVDGKVTPVTLDAFAAPKDQTCPTCNGPMVVRSGKYGSFYSCMDYPSCKGWKKIPYGKKCPECGNELYRTIFHHPPRKGPVLCCMNYPKCKYVEDLHEEEFADEQKEKKSTFKNMEKNVEKWRKTPFSPDEE